MTGKTIWVVGGDGRQRALAELLTGDGHRVHTLWLESGGACRPETGPAGAEEADCVILPLPALTGEGKLNVHTAFGEHRVEEVLDALRPGQLVCVGMAGEKLTGLARERGLVLRDYFAREEVALLNAIPTAEGAIQIALEQLPITLHAARVLLLGFGRLGAALLPRLIGLGARVKVAARSHAQQALARSMGADPLGLEALAEALRRCDLVINTVPALLLGREELTALGKEGLIIDLASRPGGVDFQAARELGVTAIHALALPGKVAPVSAGGYLLAAVYHILEELGVS